MTPRLSHILIGVAFVIGLLGLVVFGLDAYHKRSGTQAEHNAAVASGEAQTHEAQARATDPAIQDLQAKLQAREADLGRLSRERDELRRKLAALPRGDAHSIGDNPSPVQPVGPNDPDSGNSGELDLLRATVEKDAEYIDALEADSVVKDSLITAQTKRADEWEAACHARERQAQAQEEATKAWKSAVKTAEVKGGVKGVIGWEILRRVLGVH